jgi:hypothetical protein
MIVLVTNNIKSIMQKQHYRRHHLLGSIADVDGDGELILGELTLADNRILIPRDFTENDIIGDLNLCDLIPFPVFP